MDRHILGELPLYKVVYAAGILVCQVVAADKDASVSLDVVVGAVFTACSHEGDVLRNIETFILIRATKAGQVL